MGKLRDRPLKRTGTGAGYFLPPAQLVEHEIASLKRMSTIRWAGAFASWGASLLAAAREASNKGDLNVHVSFEARDPRGSATEPPHIISVGARIELATPPLVSYFIAIGNQTNGHARQGLKKLHFDLDCIPNSSEPKPALHVQFPGRMPPALTTVGYPAHAFDHLIPKLDKPRIPSLPMSFALLTHCAFLEYHTTEDDLRTFIKTPEWMSVVRAAEREVFGPFFTYSHSWLESASNEKHSLLNYFYGL